MFRTYGWLITIIASLIAGTGSIMWNINDRLIRVEERQLGVLSKLDKVIHELRKHEEETRKP